VRVVNLPAGPARAVPKDDIFRFMPAFRDAFYTFAGGEDTPYDLIHANFWMSGWVACEAKRDLGLPFAQTFHPLGEVKKREQGDADTSPPARKAAELRIVEEANRILAPCPAEVDELTALYEANPARLSSCRAGWTARLSVPWLAKRQGNLWSSPMPPPSSTSGGSSRERA
jgi:D-inositol-3-phosphate glycosyltransferase